jgi:hypothetical protein
MDKGWILHFKKARTSLHAPWMVITCASCNTTHRVDREEGIVESVRHSYIDNNYDSRVQAKESGSTDIGKSDDISEG